MIDFDWESEYIAEDLLANQRRGKPQASGAAEEEKKGGEAAKPTPAPKTFYALIKFEKDTLSQE